MQIRVHDSSSSSTTSRSTAAHCITIVPFVTDRARRDRDGLLLLVPSLPFSPFGLADKNGPRTGEIPTTVSCTATATATAAVCQHTVLIVFGSFVALSIFLDKGHWHWHWHWHRCRDLIGAVVVDVDGDAAADVVVDDDGATQLSGEGICCLCSGSSSSSSSSGRRMAVAITGCHVQVLLLLVTLFDGRKTSRQRARGTQRRTAVRGPTHSRYHSLRSSCRSCVRR